MVLFDQFVIIRFIRSSIMATQTMESPIDYDEFAVREQPLADRTMSLAPALQKQFDSLLDSRHFFSLF